MMKKFITAILTCILILTLCACDLGSSGKKTSDKTSATDSQTISSAGGGQNSGGQSAHTVHMDDDGDGFCDICGQSLSAAQAETDGKYLLTVKTVDGKDVTDDYIFSALVMQGESAVWYETDCTGRTETDFTVGGLPRTAVYLR